MKVPVLTEIQISDYSVKNLLQVFEFNKVGEGPSFMDISHVDIDGQKEIVTRVATVLKKMEINPKFPFPFYIISKLPPINNPIVIINKKDELPHHFFKRPKRLKNKEKSLLGKTKMLADKISNLDLEHKIKHLKDVERDQKILFLKTRECAFYEELVGSLEAGD